MTERREIALRDGMVVEAIIGYRFWRLAAEDGTVWLGSVYVGDLWPQQAPIQRRCYCSLPERRHTCGIHAWSGAPPRPSRSPWFVGGEVALWGEVVTHEEGYRAEFAQPVCFFQAGDDLLPKVAALQYDIPMVTLP